MTLDPPPLHGPHAIRDGHPHTIVQLLMSFGLGWLAEHAGLVAGYALLAVLYAIGTAFAFRASTHGLTFQPHLTLVGAQHVCAQLGNTSTVRDVLNFL